MHADVMRADGRRCARVRVCRACARAPAFATIFERVAAYIKERSSVRPIFHACIAILDARDASGTRPNAPSPPHLAAIKRIHGIHRPPIVRLS